MNTKRETIGLIDNKRNLPRTLIKASRDSLGRRLDTLRIVLGAFLRLAINVRQRIMVEDRIYRRRRSLRLRRNRRKGEWWLPTQMR